MPRGHDNKGRDLWPRTAGTRLAVPSTSPLDPLMLVEALKKATAALREVYVRTGDPACTPAYDLGFEVLLRAERYGVAGLPIAASRHGG